jgi:hypothetical protein
MFIQTILQTILRRKKNAALTQNGPSTQKPSPLVQRVLSEMKKHSQTKEKMQATPPGSNPKDPQ